MKPLNPNLTPNPLRQALAKAVAPGEHPGPDLLTALAEGSLLARERETVLEHLAGCAECRAVLSLSAVELEPEHELELVAAAAPMLAAASPIHAAAGGTSSGRIAGSEERKAPWKSRMWMAWAAAAAGVAIVSVVALRFAYQRPAQVASAPEAPKMPAVHAGPPEPVAPPAAEARTAPALQQTRALKKAEVPAELKRATGAAAAGAVGQAIPAQVSSQSVAVSAEPAPMRDALRATDQAVQAQQQQSQPAVEESTQVIGLEQRQLESAQSARAAAKVAPVPANAAAIGGFLTKSANMSLAVRAHWRIEQGHLERAFGNGPWQPALTQESAPMRVVSVVGADVWAGGANQVLYRSHDDGAAWQRVTLPQKNGEGHAIAHIRFASATSGTIEADDGTTWTTSDGGTTWN